jgi:hypothetical protein
MAGGGEVNDRQSPVTQKRIDRFSKGLDLRSSQRALMPQEWISYPLLHIRSEEPLIIGSPMA